MVIFVEHPLILRWGPGSHQTHVPLQHVEKLGKFVQAGFADKFTDAGLFGAVRQQLVADDPGIPLQLEHKAAGDPILLHIFLFQFVGVGIHTAEFVHPEHLAVPANPLLTVKNRAGRGDIDGRADKNSQNRRNQAAYQSAYQIQPPL